MPISTGFYKKIANWVVDESKTQVKFRPFLTNGNPYKARVFLVSANASPVFLVEQAGEPLFAEALINHKILTELYGNELSAASREFKGSLQFEQWMQEVYDENVLYTSLNTYQTNDAKLAKTLDEKNYARGQVIFSEVLEEFQPEIIILQGSVAFSQFKTMYADQLEILNMTDSKVQDIEDAGAFAKLRYTNGRVATVLVTRSMSYFGKDGAKFEQFKEHLMKML